MTIRLQGTWEPERVARVIEMWNPANPDLAPWRDDCVARIRRQIDDAASKRFASGGRARRQKCERKDERIKESK